MSEQYKLPDPKASDVTFALPDAKSYDVTFAHFEREPSNVSYSILIRSGSLFLGRGYSHRGSYFHLPCEFIEGTETPESACVRGFKEFRGLVKSLSSQIGVDLGASELELSIVRKLATDTHPMITRHYFEVTAVGESVLSGPEYFPQWNEEEHQRVYIPFAWVPLDNVSTHLGPQVAAICRS